MESIEAEAQKKHFRGHPEADRVEKQASGEALKDVTMFELMAAFRKVLTDIKKQESVHHVEKVRHTIEEQTDYVLNRLQDGGRTGFRALCADFKSCIKIVVTFLAVLEMLKERQINLYIENDDPSHFFLDLKPVDEIIGTS